ncbi:hypothetical protein E4O96_22050 [Pseudomonas fluorescens]|nr:hypothetical protein [Pseudomonas fluorescens]MCK3850641.1 hypothetical protein [Pseudomonas sp. W2Jun17]
MARWNELTKRLLGYQAVHDFHRHHKTNVGAGLARDASASVFQLHRGDAIAGKPAPTLGAAMGVRGRSACGLRTSAPRYRHPPTPTRPPTARHGQSEK